MKPDLAAQLRFVEWTAEGRLRHAAFLALRAAKEAREVRRESRIVRRVAEFDPQRMLHSTLRLDDGLKGSKRLLKAGEAQASG